jgi:LysR family transcriptional regulator, transcriptional activator for bauABCD operon
VALLVLSGAYLGFLPNHYAAGFVANGRMRAVAPQRLNYRCGFYCIQRLAPAPTRVAQAFRECLLVAQG